MDLISVQIESSTFFHYVTSEVIITLYFRTVLNEVFASVQGGVVGSGHVYSMAHSHSYVNAYGFLNEQINGLTAIQVSIT